MYGDILAQMVAWKMGQNFRAVADLLVTRKPCFLFSVTLTGGTGGVSTAVIRDGHTDTGDIVVDLAAITSDKDHRNYLWPKYFKKGLFVDVGSNITSVTGLILEVSGKE